MRTKKHAFDYVFLSHAHCGAGDEGAKHLVRLSFGMTVSDAAKALDGYVLHPGELTKNYSKDVLSPNFDLYGGQGTSKFPLEVNLLFAKDTGKLEHVSLDFVIRTADRVVADSGAFATLAAASARMLADLKAKYGMPEEQQGSCPVTGRGLLIAGSEDGYRECKGIWRQTGQVIELEQAVFNHAGSLEVFTC
jgi:hypothetical protein